MADEQIVDAGAGSEEDAPKGTSPLKIILLLLVVMLVEGGAIFGFMAFSGGPAEVNGDVLEQELEAERNKLVEIEIIKGRISNIKTGRLILYDSEIFVRVKTKNAEKAKKEIEASLQAIKTEIAIIYAQAEGSHFAEPSLGTLTRVIQAMMDKKFKLDDDNQPIIQSVLIPKCIPIRVN